MDTFSSQCQSIMCIKQCFQCFKPRIKYKVIFYKIIVDIYVRDIHNYMIKSFDNGGLASLFDSVTHKVLIINTTLR